MYRCVLLLCFLLCAGCGPTARQTVALLQEEGHFTPQRFATEKFVLFGLLRPGESHETLHVFIEGDGRAWLSRKRVSSDPTPRDPITLRLAEAASHKEPVLYLARPCQYVTGPDARFCTIRYWTDSRLAPEVIASLDAAISMAKEKVGAQSIVLTGYSGGGGAAVLVAAQRHDVAFLGTVAGMLDHTAWTELHENSPLHTSLNPLDAASELHQIPQRHMSSLSDRVIPPSLSQNFCQRTGQPQACVVVSGVPHSGAWEKVWEYGTP